MLKKMGLIKTIAGHLKNPRGIIGRLLARKMIKGNQQMNAQALELMAPSSSDKILEIGFGPGVLMNKVAQITTEGFIGGIEPSQTMVKLASKRNKKYLRNNLMELHHAGVQEIPFKDNYFDKVCSINTIYFWENLDLAFREILRVLKPGGNVFIGLRTRDYLESMPVTQYYFKTYQYQQLVQIMEHAGFKNIRQQYLPSNPNEAFFIIGEK